MMMNRVAILTHCLSAGGTTTYLLGLVRLMQKSGMETVVVAQSGVMDRSFSEAGAIVIDLPEIFDHTSFLFSLYFRSLSREYTSSITYSDSNVRASVSRNEFMGLCTLLGRVIRKSGLKKRRSLPNTWVTGTSSIVYSSYVVARVLKSFNPDVVFTTQLHPTVTALTARMSLGHKPPIYEFVMGVKNRLDTPAPWFSQRDRLKDKILAPTGEIRKRLELIRPDRVLLEVGNCIDGNLYSPQVKEKRQITRSKYGIDPDEFVMLYVSSDSDIYTPSVIGVCEAFLSFRRRKNCGYLLIAGPERFRDSFRLFELEAQSFSTRKCMQHLGKVVDGLEDIYNIADLFVGVGRTAREAMLCGVPTIVYGVTGHPGLVTPLNADAVRFFNYAGRGCERLPNSQDLTDEFEKIHTMSKEELQHLSFWGRDYVLKSDSYDSLAHILHLV